MLGFDRFAKSKHSHCSHLAAFTLIELVIVIMIFGLVAAAIVRPSLGNFSYWEQEGAIRKLNEQITFLFTQAIVDGINYRLQYDLESIPHSYQIGQVSDFISSDQNTTLGSGPGGQLIAKEIDNFLNPLPANIGEMSPPVNIPSLAKPIVLPEGMSFEDIRTVRGDYVTTSVEDPAYTNFSPRGYVEFTVIHIKLQRFGDSFVTIVVNPFTGLTDVYREYKEFEWSYGQKQS